MNPIAFQLGPIDVYWYSILSIGGILVAALLATRTARLWAQDPLYVWNALPWVVALGLVGARLYHVLAIPPSVGIDRCYYARHPAMILAVWEGGLDAYGALVGGTAGMLVAFRHTRRSLWRWLDIAAPGVALGQSITRWGNWINQEQYGRPTDAPWGTAIQPEFRLPGYEEFERFQPLFAYESAWSLITCIALLVLIWRRRDRLVPGLVAGIYSISYATIRFLLEFVRLDRPTLAGLPIAQIVSLCIILLWTGLIPWRLKSHRAAQQSEPTQS
jgi:phosphatidylglycerol:prolipoprotein diacylglycerol transferase